jgi:hypothetical protein
MQEAEPNSSFNFIPTDVSLIKNVDNVCDEIKSKEQNINMFFLSQRTLDPVTSTSSPVEGLRIFTALSMYSRNLFIDHPLPLLRSGTGLWSVISVLAAAHEEQLIDGNFDMVKVSIRNSVVKVQCWSRLSRSTLPRKHRK